MRWLKFFLWVSITLMFNAISFTESTLPTTNSSSTNTNAEAKVRIIVEDLGKTLQTVLHQSPNAIEEMKEKYSPYVYIAIPNESGVS